MNISEKNDISIPGKDAIVLTNLKDTLQKLGYIDNHKDLFGFEALFDSGENIDPKLLKKMLDDACDVLTRHQSAKVEMVTRNGEAVYMDFLLRDQNLDKFEEIKNYKRGEEGVTRSTAIEEHGTKKTAIVSKGKVKYKK